MLIKGEERYIIGTGIGEIFGICRIIEEGYACCFFAQQKKGFCIFKNMELLSLKERNLLVGLHKKFLFSLQLSALCVFAVQGIILKQPLK